MKVADIIERLEQTIGLDGAPRRLRTVVEYELTTHFGLPAIEAAEQAERLESSLSKQIVAAQQEAEREGTLVTIVVIGSDLLQVAGSCCAFPDDDAAVSEAKRRRIFAAPLLEAIRALSFSDFEKFGAAVLRLLGARMVRVTPHSSDQGIDFYGVLSLGELKGEPTPFFRLTHDVEVRFAGQAKHYPTSPIGPSVVRELVGAVSLARYGTFSDDSIDFFEDLELRPLNPLVCLLFTTGTFTSGASELATKAGIIAKGGAQLAVFLADCGIGMKREGTSWEFDELSFRSWLDSDWSTTQ